MTIELIFGIGLEKNGLPKSSYNIRSKTPRSMIIDELMITRSYPNSGKYNLKNKINESAASRTTIASRVNKVVLALAIYYLKVQYFNKTLSV